MRADHESSRGADLTEQGDVDLSRHDRDRLQNSLGGRRQCVDPGQNGVPYGRGHRHPRRGQHLGDVERVTARPLEEDGGVLGAGELRDRLAAQGWHLETEHTRMGGERPERRLQFARLIPIGDQDDRPGAADAAAQEQDQVAGRVVGPMQILDHDERRLAEQTQEPLEQLVAGNVLGGQCGHRRDRSGDVVNWTERGRGAQRVAAAAPDR